MRYLSASAAIQIPHPPLSPLRKHALKITTTRKERTCFPQQPLSLRVVNSADLSRNFRVVVAAAAAAKLKTAEMDEEEVKYLLTSFLKELTLKDTVDFCKSDNFIDNLVSKLHSIHRIGFHVGRELTHVEIRDALIPSIKSLVAKNRDILVNREKLPIPRQTSNNSSLDSIKPNGMVVPVVSSNIKPNDMVVPVVNSKIQRNDMVVPVVNSNIQRNDMVVPVVSSNIKPNDMVVPVSGNIQPNDMVVPVVSSNIKPNDMVVPVSGNIQPNDMVVPVVSSNIQPNDMVPVSSSKQADWQLPSNIVNFLIDISMDRKTMEEIKSQLPPFENESWVENMESGVGFLLENGMPHGVLRNIIYRCPRLLRFTRDKEKATIDYLYELGISMKNIVMILKINPTIITFNVDNKLRPIAEYFRSIGIKPSVFLCKCPAIWCRSLETSVKPVTQFFLERGYSMNDIRSMVLRYPKIYTFSLEKNLIPKWDFFLTMDYPVSELVKFPQYFGCNLEETIKPRYEQLNQSGVKMSLSQVFGSSYHDFEKVLNFKMNEMIDDFLESKI